MRDVLFTTKEDAENVLAAMRDILKQKSMVSVADLKILSDLKIVYSDSTTGWKNLDDVKILEDTTRDVHGYILDLPAPEDLFVPN